MSSNQAILIDSSFLYAAFNKNDKRYQKAMEFLDSVPGIPIVPEIILPEVAFLFVRDFGHYAVEKFLGEFIEARLKLETLTYADIERAQAILQAYSAAKFDLVDACIMALAERLQITQVCTFDRRDFSIFRPKHCDYLELLP